LEKNGVPYICILDITGGIYFSFFFQSGMMKKICCVRDLGPYICQKIGNHIKSRPNKKSDALSLQKPILQSEVTAEGLKI
jgi:hypothetical protein